MFYPDQTESLHLFVSNIKCSIMKRERAQRAPIDIELAPDPYVSFISFPKELVKQKETKFSKFKGLFRLGANLRLETVECKKSGKIIRTVNGYPRTRKLTNTYEPEWTDEYIHLIVNRINEHGEPVDVSGAILMLCLLDHLPQLDDNVIGCFPLNLAHMLKTLKSGKTQHEEGPGQRGSVIGSKLQFVEDKDTGAQTLTLKQPLLKNGKESGWISCKLDCYWTDSEGGKTLATAQRDTRRLSMLDSRKSPQC